MKQVLSHVKLILPTIAIGSKPGLLPSGEADSGFTISGYHKFPFLSKRPTTGSNLKTWPLDVIPYLITCIANKLQRKEKQVMRVCPLHMA